MDWTFDRIEGRGIDVDLGPDLPGWNEALADSVSSMPPRGARTRGLSTYWIDRTLDRLRGRVRDGRPLTSGNSTEIVLDQGVVVARSLYELFEDESMSPDALEALLLAWRSEVVAHRHEFWIEDGYRRQGFG